MPTERRRPGNRRNAPLFITLPPDELARLRAFAADAGRPISWVVRDALRLYLDAVEPNAAALARVKLNARAAGRTEPRPMGRPPKAKAGANVR